MLINSFLCIVRQLNLNISPFFLKQFDFSNEALGDWLVNYNFKHFFRCYYYVLSYLKILIIFELLKMSLFN